MKTKINKYFLAVWLIVVAVYNITLFLLVNHFAVEFFNNINFWILYGSMMFALILWFVFGILDKNTKLGGLSLLSTFVFIYMILVFIMTTIMFFFTKKILSIAIIIPMLLITGVLAIFTVFATKNKKQIVNNSNHLFEITNVELLEDYFKHLADTNKNFENILLDLANKCEGLTNILNIYDIEKLDKRIIEYASFIKRNTLNDEESNIQNNINKIKDLLQEREALIAKTKNNADNN